MAALTAFSGPAAAKGTLDIAYKASAQDGNLIGTYANPDGTVIVITNLGTHGVGQILQLTPQGKKAYNSSIIKVFSSDADGANPQPSLTPDTAGNLWGMTFTSNPYPQGTLFKLTETSGVWSLKTVLVMPDSIGFHGSIGSGYGKTAFDKQGNLYGLAIKGGYGVGCDSDGCGRIFKIPAGAMDDSVPAGKKKPKVKILYTFPNNGAWPAGLVRDKHGDLFGIEYSGGDNGRGTIWEVSPPTTKGGPWAGENIYKFCATMDGARCDDGFGPSGTPIVDANGDLFGTTQFGGPDNGQGGGGDGTVWVMTPPDGTNGWQLRSLHAFQSTCPVDYDFGVKNPIGDTLLSKTGQVLTFVGNGGRIQGCTPFENVIQGGLISADPVSGADTIVNNEFGIQSSDQQYRKSGPIGIASSPSLLNKDIFGTSQNLYDASTDTVLPGVVFRIAP
jgi:hypothetical protein